MSTHVPVAVITGAAQGIGRRAAEILAEKGYALALNDVNSAADALASVSTLGADAIEAPGDVSDETAVARIAEAVLARFGRIDVLVNNAGISFIKPTEKVEVAEWRRVQEVNLTGPFLMVRAFAPAMLRQKSGAIINIASIAGLGGLSQRAAYNTSKHGLIGFTQTLAAEWGGHGIRCNAVCPGWVKTAMDAADQVSAGYTDEDITNRVPMARFANVDDIAQAIAFLADPKMSGFINGETLRVDGGWMADFGWESIRLRSR
jgi:NAD(P)-dependent dehydrogenase (short-subunit alcohol dehydrogenase family)